MSRRRRVGRQRLGDLDTRPHQAEEALVAGALALMTQHLHQEDAVILGQLVALVEIMLGAIDFAGEVGQRIALGIDVRPERPQSAAADAFAALGGVANFVLRDYRPRSNRSAPYSVSLFRILARI